MWKRDWETFLFLKKLEISILLHENVLRYEF